MAFNAWQEKNNSNLILLKFFTIRLFTEWRNTTIFYHYLHNY